jgi:hypothetical protein
MPRNKTPPRVRTIRSRRKQRSCRGQPTVRGPSNTNPLQNPLRIFLSHKLGQSREKAKRVAAALSLLANDKIVIVFSADFDKGIQWDVKIRRELDTCDWFVLLYDGADANHDWCLYEAGYFHAQIQKHPDKKLICLHDARDSLPNPLRGFTSVPACDEDLFRLFKQIYLDEPWKIRPDLFAEQGQVEIQEMIQRIISEVSNREEILGQFTLSPTFTFQVKTAAIPDLKSGLIPLDTQVSGDGGWETVFDKPVATVAWKWAQLIED